MQEQPHSIWRALCFCPKMHNDRDEREPIMWSQAAVYYDRTMDKSFEQTENLSSCSSAASGSSETLPLLGDGEDDATAASDGALLENTSLDLAWQMLQYGKEPDDETHKEVQWRWKMILSKLGFEGETTVLLTVTPRGSMSDGPNAERALNMLTHLSVRTAIFHPLDVPPVRYLVVLDRLLLLDVAEEFVAEAERLYPVEEWGDLHNMSLSCSPRSTVGARPS
ncbi:uncharacterized protein LOC116938771 [Petromyzon marinus]|uniref:uncharacterized protein LOC116938771 n=1 Tax=Petromyzon marinus TaxID=7757 RepID=UPI003F70D7D3